MKRNLVTIGTFDGVHLGHLKLLASLKAAARRRGLRTLVALFEEPPKSFFLSRPVPLLTTALERKNLLKAVGIDEVRVLRFDARLAKTSHSKFLASYLLGRCRAAGLVVGPDFAFGRGRHGGLAFLKEACRRRGLLFAAAPLVRSGEAKVSSSRIRDLLQRGKVAEAARLLGRPYLLSGPVTRGRGLGARIGIPTANIQPDPRLLLPRGVFAVCVQGGPFRKPRIGVCNIGTRPTLDATGSGVSVEVHVPGHSGELYGRRLSVGFLRFIRGERRFPSVEALLERIRKDIASALRAG